MKFAKDFRGIARESLRGKWYVAVAAGLVSMLLGGMAFPGLKINVNVSEPDLNFKISGKTIFSASDIINSNIAAFILGALSFFIIAALVVAVIYYVIGAAVWVGYARFNLDLVDRREAKIKPVFSYFPYWKTNTITRLLITVYIFLWSLLLAIPDIVAGYSYAMTDFILAENPNITPREAIERSKAMMNGKRWKLFCLELSFTGWGILAFLTFGIGNLWLVPYRKAATAAFYREISGTEGLKEYAAVIK